MANNNQGVRSGTFSAPRSDKDTAQWQKSGTETRFPPENQRPLCDGRERGGTYS